MEINKIIAIAISEYDDVELNKIQNTKSDIAEIISILTDKYVFEDIEFIFEKKDTTRKTLFSKLNYSFVNASEDENILLFFAGHGEYNQILETAYWLPSDSDPKDPSTWININDILTFINASKAFHVSIISDSCFSGAIFEVPKRGGGIQAYESKKSRLALTSGGIEKVSDGARGKKSPFAENLIKELLENNLEEMPFNILANNLILTFNENRIQTPMFGALHGVGHQGGAFIFKLKGVEIAQPDNINDYLKSRLAHLYIPIGKEHIQIIRQIQPINKEKHELVKNQKYEKAMELRDEEKRLEDFIYKTCPEYLDNKFNNVKISKENYSKIESVKKSIVEFDLEHLDKKKIITKNLTTLELEHLQTHKELTSEHKLMLKSIAERNAGYFDFLNPSRDFFMSEKSNLIEKYLLNISNLYTYFLQIKANSDIDFLEQKKIALRNILIKIYELEIKILYRWYSDDIDEFIALKKLDIELLNWIRN
ncbi:hypothetical protein OA93_00420 [Flavobacterium sp. KMS]|uniref:UvrB/UvrC motif-containing protein n=1 Tax=Flavobacterium sp. KMS TaxID=1566023 RepID=UPI00057E35F6|nr:UvrB/UvrC motif-containing protein [Flavobacterium sp. KMS]KIC00116.1 hypothetical protein OA93_00420 [Flavobacterium sp. KMS]